MDTVKYDLEKFLESSDAIIANINKIKDDLSKISSEVASSSDHWTGRSHNSFVKADAPLMVCKHNVNYSFLYLS